VSRARLFPPFAPPRTITIVAKDNGRGLFDVHEGERYVTHLCWDELLGTIARLTHPKLQGEPSYGMGTSEEWLARQDRQQARRRQTALLDPKPALQYALQRMLHWHVHRDSRADDKPLPFEQQPAEVRRSIEAMRAATGNPDWMPQ